MKYVYRKKKVHFHGPCKRFIFKKLPVSSSESNPSPGKHHISAQALHDYVAHLHQSYLFCQRKFPMLGKVLLYLTWPARYISSSYLTSIKSTSCHQLNNNICQERLI